MSVYQELGEPLFATQKLRILVQELENRISREPNNPELYLQAGELLDQAGFFQKAYQYVAKAEALAPEAGLLAEFRSRRYHHHHHDGGDCDICDALCGLCVLDTCCECMGGDLIECC